MSDAVVFDTNAYQSLPSKSLDALLTAEADNDIVAYADSWVLIELIGKLVHEPQRLYARAALRKLWHHCGGDEFRMVVDCEEQVCQLLFGVAPEGHEATRDRLAETCRQVACLEPGGDETEVLEAADELAAHLDSIERQRVDMVYHGLIRAVVPAAESWDAVATSPDLRDAVSEWIDSGAAVRALAESEVRRAYKDVGHSIPEPVPEEMIDTVLDHFSYPLHVESASIRSAVERGADLSQRGRQNSVWDAQIAFNAGQTLPGGRTILLITDDALLLTVADEVGEHSVRRLGDYLVAMAIPA